MHVGKEASNPSKIRHSSGEHTVIRKFGEIWQKVSGDCSSDVKIVVNT